MRCHIFVTTAVRGLALTAFTLLAACIVERRDTVVPADDAPEPAPSAAHVHAVAASERQDISPSTNGLRTTCSAAPERPDEPRRSELTTSRSLHDWTVHNDSDRARKFVVVLEIADDQGRVKTKEVPGEVKARSKVEDSSSIALTTTYARAGTVRIEARTTIRAGSETLATTADACRFDVP